LSTAFALRSKVASSKFQFAGCQISFVKSRRHIEGDHRRPAVAERLAGESARVGRLYRYYISQAVMKRGTDACPIKQIPAAEIERIAIAQIRSLLQTSEVIVQTWRAARKTDKGITENDVRCALLEFEPIWNGLFPAEQARIVELLVERVDLQPDGIDMRLRVERRAVPTIGNPIYD
jgi:hypothetical protein